MRTHRATVVQIVVSLILIITSVFTPAIRLLLFNHVQWIVIAMCVTGILYLQTLKIIYAGEKKLKAKIKHQSQLIDGLLHSNALNAGILKDIAIPELFKQNADEFIARLHASGISITELVNFGIDRNIIAHYELFYYIGKAREQQELLTNAKKLNGDTTIGNTPIIKEISEPDNATYLRTVSA